MAYMVQIDSIADTANPFSIDVRQRRDIDHRITCQDILKPICGFQLHNCCIKVVPQKQLDKTLVVAQCWVNVRNVCTTLFQR